MLKFFIVVLKCEKSLWNRGVGMEYQLGTASSFFGVVNWIFLLYLIIRF